MENNNGSAGRKVLSCGRCGSLVSAQGLTKGTAYEVVDVRSFGTFTDYKLQLGDEAKWIGNGHLVLVEVKITTTGVRDAEGFITYENVPL